MSLSPDSFGGIAYPDDDDPLVPALIPFDEYNLRLQQQTHPSDWVNPKPDGRYNLIVIGAGTAGLVTAAGAAGLGAKVALIEKHLTGGDCLNVGCVPSKALIRCARAAFDARRGSSFGIKIVGPVEVDFPAVMERMRRIRAEIAPNDSVHRFKKLGVDVFLGAARFNGPDTVEVEGQQLQFARAVIATGARAVAPPIKGLAEAGYLTNETLFSLTQLPRRLAVIGGGPIGCEMAQSFARFGSQVTLIEADKQILIREDYDAARRVEAALVRDGVKIVCGGKAAEVHRQGDERIIIVECDGQRHEIVVDAILVGVGRAPNVEDLNLETVGVQYDKQAGVTVDDRLRTTNKRIYAAGDICSKYKFTHTADALARIVIQNALFFGRAKASTLTIPWCTYTDPEIAHVGMYERDAEAAGIPVQTFTVELKDVDRAILDGEDDGLLKVHVRKGTDKIIGATLVARHAGEMISEITLAMVAGVGLGTLSKTIHPYPTQADIMKRAGDAYSRTRLTPRVKSLVTRFLGWRR
ncbi:MAG: mercuric reductase [Phycisphaerae bacterium]|jgi:pyruvate/2-oxoglutarate dehydrogenase complex dihydrolipoamide dehydrogenase (E3) component|nr:MAG: mercuric reductase [Phycisphaerae bacterium]